MTQVRATLSAVLITGAATRLGRHMALHFARHGYDIAIHYHHSASEAATLAEEIQAMGRRTAVVKADLADADTLPALVDEVLATLPHCRVLINNASVFEQAPFLQASLASFESNMQVNLRAPVLLTQSFAKATHGERCVINMLDSKITTERHSYFFYLLSKKALAEFTRMAAAELAASSVRVNAICPGAVLPGKGSPDGDQELKTKSEALPLGKVATPEEVAASARHLVESPSITGQLLFIDGGGHLI